jgi:drug/metabolite transporter (DMT)-like permease
VLNARATAIEMVSGWTRAARRRARGSVASHAALLATILLWSANGAVLKVGVTNVRPIPFTAARFAVAALVMTLFAVLSGRDLRRRPPLKLLSASVLFGYVLNQLTFTYGLRLSTVVDVSLIVGLSPIMAALVPSPLSRGGGRPPGGWSGSASALRGWCWSSRQGPGRVPARRWGT